VRRAFEEVYGTLQASKQRLRCGEAVEGSRMGRDFPGGRLGRIQV
jgi:hypothetical protein